ncbi:WD40-repeat-containing domain protein [Ampelomyces quisqualis]|uniref:WD40-repeat-containing domain protein n=1 Tax=Ampelomyces quisqualis TaxID=50730 RepID=A0A6A5R1R9_AMPQU|nr:WD40-repeat-containing domain protein [Ampelomyces quisqualis]
MAETSAQLKRKRESAIGLQKAKKQRKSHGVAGNDSDAGEGSVLPAPVVEPTPESHATPQSQDPSQSKQKPQKSQTNAARDQLTPTEAEDHATPPRSASPADEATINKSFKERVEESKAAGNVEVVESKKKLAQSSTKSKKQKHKSGANRALPASQGGWFLPSDPTFSLDEKHILLAHPKALQVYSTETSLLVSSLPLGHAAFVTAYALSSTKPHQVYVADSSELVTLWDWVKGTKVGRWDIGGTARNIAVVTHPGSNEDLVFCHEKGDKHVVNVHALRTKSQASKTEVKRIFKTNSAITHLQILLQGKYVIIATADTITVGKRLKPSRIAVQEFEYMWREITFSKRITTCNTYFRQPEASEKGKKTAQDQRDVLDLAVGDDSGAILLFEDMLASFAAVESIEKGSKNKTDSAESLRPKRFHWHRTAVGSVKWSLDGNYFISGGDETVLTIWQMSTGTRQHLPHLTAAIENIVVSPSGSSYALSLANNSVIVISTAELEAKTNIIGIQSRRVDTEQLPKEGGAPWKRSFYALEPIPLAVDPSNAQHVLFTVPSSQPRNNEGLRPEPYLQTFDVANQRPIARQALTRNNATDPNMGPEGHRILEPGVKFLQISYDGKCLATVDEWLPPRADTVFLNEGNAEFTEEQRLLRREVHLKLWRRDEKSRQWVLETRIDAPHQLEDRCGHARILDMVEHPTEHGFATIGEDYVVRIWKPKTRFRDGIVVRGANAEGLITWSLHRSIELPKPDNVWLSEPDAGRQHHRTLRLAFSSDGSVLAAGVSGTSESDQGLIHLIDTSTATIRRSMAEINATALCGVGIVGRYLVAITDRINVWDLIKDDLVYCTSIHTIGVDNFDRTSIVRLATNEADGTFAVSLPQFEMNYNASSRVKKVSSKICVYCPEKKEPLSSYTIPAVTLGLTARKGKGERGYITLDSVSCINIIAPTAGLRALPMPQKVEDFEVQRITDIGKDNTEDAEAGATMTAIGEITLENEYDKPVVTQQDLEEIFHNNNAPQAPKDMFRAVLRLFGGVAKTAA